MNKCTCINKKIKMRQMRENKKEKVSVRFSHQTCLQTSRQNDRAFWFWLTSTNSMSLTNNSRCPKHNRNRWVRCEFRTCFTQNTIITKHMATPILQSWVFFLCSSVCVCVCVIGMTCFIQSRSSFRFRPVNITFDWGRRPTVSIEQNTWSAHEMYLNLLNLNRYVAWTSSRLA